MTNAIAGVAGPSQLHGSVDNAMQALGGMDSEGFLKLLVAQLQYQSPLEPSDPGDLMTQTAALAQLDATQQLLAMQQRGLGLQQAVMAAGLLGEQVTGIAADGTNVEGPVEAIRYTVQGPILDVNGVELRLGEIQEISRSVGGSSLSTSAPAPTPSPQPESDDELPSGLLET